jgi:cytochrome b561/polyisoprenoid-binding protein YceI
VAILLHWTIAAAIVLQIVLASRMEGRTPEAFAVMQLHKSVGITILLLSVARLAWRLIHPPPPMPWTMAPWEKTLAALTHGGFYVVMIGMPLTGWIMVSTSRYMIPTLLFGEIPWPHIPFLAGMGGGVREFWHEVGEAGHDSIIKVFYLLLALHVAGALKHQLFSRDEPVLARMAPGARPGAWLEPRLFLIALAAAGVIAFGLRFDPPKPPVAPPPAVADADDAVLPVEATSAESAASDAADDKDDGVPAEPVRWAVEKGSEIDFETAWGDQAIKGRFGDWTADIRFSPKALDRSTVKVTIDVVSAATGDAQRDEALPAPDWFDADNHAKATFSADRFEHTGKDRYVAHGTLTLRGVSKPVDLPFRLQIDKDKARVRGVTSLDRTAFGVGQGEWTSTDQIPAKVSVSIDLKARRN